MPRVPWIAGRYTDRHWQEAEGLVWWETIVWHRVSLPKVPRTLQVRHSIDRHPDVFVCDYDECDAFGCDDCDDGSSYVAFPLR